MKQFVLLLALIFTYMNVHAQSEREISTSVLTVKEQSSTPANPGAGKYKVYTKAGKLRLLSSAGTETSVGSGAGSINYVTTNFDAEDGSTSGWSCYADAAGSSPVDGTGGSPNTTFTNVTSSTLSGLKLFRITKSSGASRQGEGCSYNFSIDASYKAKVLRVTFPYISSANIVDGDFRVYVYDVTNSRLIEVIDRDISANTFGQFIGSFQASSDSTSYRLIIHTATTSTTAATLDLDDVTVGPQPIYRGAVITPWQTYAPTITGFNGTSHTDTTGRWRRIGDSIEIEIYHQVTGAGSGGSAVNYSLPSGLSIDSTKHTNGGTVGSAETYNIEGASAFHPAGLIISGNTLAVLDTGGSGFYTGAMFGVGAQARLHAMVPVVGWSSGLALSEDGGQRQIELIALNAVNQTITANTTDFAATASRDTTSSWSGSVYTAPESGTYLLSFASSYNASVGGYTLSLYVNGSSVKALSLGGGTTHYEGTKNVTTLVSLTKGQTLSIRSNLSGTLDYFYINIHKIASPQTLAGSETVAARASSSSGQSVTSGATTTIIWNSKDADSHNAYNVSTGVYTVQVGGTYSIKASAAFPNTSDAVGTAYILSIMKGATAMKQYDLRSETSTSIGIRHLLVSDDLKLSKGDTISISIFHNSGVTRSLYTDSSYNTFFNRESR
jgi:hypothetical protein